MNPVERLGSAVRAGIQELCLLAALLWTTVAIALRPDTWRASVQWVLSRQIYFTGVQAIPIVAGIAVLLGTSIVLQSQVWLLDAGQSAWIGPFLVASLLREIAPLVVNIVVLLRSGSAIVTELGNMTVAGEVRVLEGQGIDPFHYLVMPRILGLSISVMALTVVFLIVAFTSGYACSVATGVQPAGPVAFMNSVLSAIEARDLLVLGCKVLLPAAMTAAICCREGLSIAPITTEVPKATMRALSRAGTALFVSSLALSILRYV